MNTIPLTIDTPDAPAVSTPITPQRFATLLRVEWRKLIDTRSGRAALAVITALCMFVPVWMLLHTEHVAEFRRYSNGAANAAALLMIATG